MTESRQRPIDRQKWLDGFWVHEDHEFNGAEIPFPLPHITAWPLLGADMFISAQWTCKLLRDIAIVPPPDRRPRSK